MELVVEPLNLHLNAETGSTLLDVLRSNEVPISYSCMALLHKGPGERSNPNPRRT